MSGFSGAGTKAGQVDADGVPTTIPKVTLESLGGGVKPYSLTDHIHEREASFHLSTLNKNEAFKIAFVPNVSPWFSGILSVLSAPLKQEMRASEVRELYEAMYGREKLLRVQNDVVQLKDIEGHHGWTVGGIQVHSSGRRVVVTGGLDNLLKGAATQCVQNLNLSLGLDEFAGIPLEASTVDGA